MASCFSSFNRIAGPSIVVMAIILAGCSNAPVQSSSNQQGSYSIENKADKSSSHPGMNNNGEVIDSSKVESGSGESVKGIGGWEGEITGKFAPRSKFKKLRIGMSSHQVINLIGQPTDEGSYVTGKAWIPFYFGSDRARTEMVYKNEGRLIFAFGAGLSTDQHLVWIINNAHEGGYR